jgi:hypothetical protein
MKALFASIILFCIPARGNFCPDLVYDWMEPDVEYITGTPAFLDTLEELEIPHMSVVLGQALGAEAVRMGIELASKPQLIAFLKQALEDGLRHATQANALDPETFITIRMHLETQRLLITFEDQAGVRNNPWDSAHRRSVTGQGTPVPPIWATLVRLDLPYAFAYRNQGNIFTIAIPWDLAL